VGILRMASLEDLATADLTAVFAPYNYNGPSIDGSSKRGQGILVPNLNADFGLAFPACTTFWMHFHFKIGARNGFLVNLNTHNVWQDVFWIDSNGYVAAYSGNPNLGWTYNNLQTQWVDYIATGTIPITAATWYDFQAEITISPTAGIIKTWIDGVQDFNLSSIRTQAVNESTNTVDCISWNGYGSGMRVDNAVIGDMTGSVNNSVIGQVSVDCHVPVTPNGSDRDWTPSTGTDDYPLVDDTAVIAGQSDYLISTGSGQRVSFHVEALKQVGGNIYAVQIFAPLTKQNAGPGSVRPYCLRGGTRYYGDTWGPSFGSWGYFSYIWNQDPAAGPGAWTEANFNASEFGLERTA
jgi:hypothetical protein